MGVHAVDHIIAEFYRILKYRGTFFFSIVHPAFYPADWEMDGKGVARCKKVSGYIRQYALPQQAWGKAMHYHRPISYYFNIISAAGFCLREMLEPEVFEDTKIPDIPLYLFAEFLKPSPMPPY